MEIPQGVCVQTGVISPNQPYEERRFQCQSCGACCRIADGICRVSDAEIARIAAYLGRTEADFIANETDVAPDRKTLMLKSRPDGACAWLTDDNRCLIHPVKPDKCRTFPYEWINADSTSVCPGLKILAEKGVEDYFDRMNA